MSGRRARGANAIMAMGFENAFGESPASGFVKMPFTSANLGEDQPLIASDLLGQGRTPYAPTLDAVDSAGDQGIPVDLRNIGSWLKLLMGDAVTTAGLPATGAITFAGQPANNATVTVGGQLFTFTSSAPTANQIRIGATLAETVANAVRVLNASAVAGVMAARYYANDRGNEIGVRHEALGIAGNSFALAASTTPDAKATVSGATLTGGAASGGYRHVFTPGAQSLPSASIEIGMPEVPEFNMNWGVKGNTLAIQMQRGGLLSATIGLIAQGETPSDTSQAGTLIERPVLRFSQGSGSVKRDGVPLADLVTGQFNFTNGLEGVPGIRQDGRVSGIDEGMVAITGQAGIRYSSRELQVLAQNGTPIALEYSWSVPGTAWSLRIIVHAVYLPRPRKAISGPGAIQVDYAWQAAGDAAGKMATFILTNDVQEY